MKIRVHLCSSVVGKNWRRKIEGNKTRDRLVNRALRRAGRVKWRGHHAMDWRVLRIWECELRRTNETRLVKRLLGFRIDE
jgi:G:T-mismatch repair DNA endonuclease (very short patch repair protein)